MRVLRRIAASADVDHRRHVELDHLLVERIPPFVGQRRRVEIAARWVGIEVAADEAHSFTQRSSSPMEFFGGTPGDCGNWQTPMKLFGIERADARDQVVADLRPFQADAVVADMVAHAGGARREDRDVGAALALQLELGAFHALADFVVADLQRRFRRHRRLVLDRLGLLLAAPVQVFRLGRVVAVAIDNHDTVAEDCGEPANAGRMARPRCGRMLRTGLHHCQTGIAVC